MGRVVFIEKDETAVNKKDKYAKQAAADQLQREQQCDNNNESKAEATCTTCDSTNPESVAATANATEEKSVKWSDQQTTTSEEATPTQEESQAQSQPETPVQENTTPEIMSSVLATMWMGDDCGNIFVHSSVDNWAQCLHTVKLKDAVIAIV